MSKQFDRRGMLRFAVGTAGAAILAACGGEAATVAPTTAPRPAGTPLAGGTGGQTPLAVAPTTAPAAMATAASVGAATTAPAAGMAPNLMVTPPAGVTLVPPPAITANMTPKGAAKYWQTVYDPPTVPSAGYHDQWISSLKFSLPNVQFKEEQYDYNSMLDKIRVANKANQGPDTAVMPILWGPEFAYSNQLLELNLADFGYKPENFWPGALKSITVNGKLYGIPTNNETMAFVYNKETFMKVGLDPNKGPETWEDVKNYSKQIKDKTGKPGFGLVAKLNAGNIPFRYMPLCWAYGGGALDETADAPMYQKSQFDSDGNTAALQWVYDVYVRDQSAPMSALTNTQTENRDLFISGEVAMMIALPGEYIAIKQKSPEVAEKMGYALMPKGPVRRAVVFGGSNIAIFKGTKDVDAVKAAVKDRTSPPWSLRFAWEGSNPGHRDGFALPEQQTRLKEIKYLDITTEMLQYGISFPTVPESSDIMNLMVPEMMQAVMTKAKTPMQAGQDAAKKVNDLIAKRK